ncbi:MULTISPECIES: hypothetical protein [Actinosynnema]|uniref:hypothetical protein n=1 Tax=Actinosynnema TaxID=40566 RepID=UPI0020A3E921|nr:hypothetical protein [Actinosynnema pretiosum]MCP2092550.1 hypothetical protein [Actinosynnema pretiosum]
MLPRLVRALLRATAAAAAATLLATLPVAPAQAQITHPVPTDLTGAAFTATAPETSGLLGAGVVLDGDAPSREGGAAPGLDHGGGAPRDHHDGSTRAYRPL